MFFIIWFSNVVLSFQRRNNKVVVALSAIFLIVLFCGNNLNRDYINYMTTYYSRDLSTYDIGFQLIGNICINLKMSYNAFLSTIIIPCYLIIFFVLYKAKTNFHMFFSLYFVFLVFYDITQVRNFIVSALLTLGIFYLYKKRNILFLITIGIASLFHSIALFYLPLLFIVKIPKNKKLYLFLATYVILAIFILKFIVSNSDIIGKIIQLFSNNEEVIIYGTSIINFGFLIPITYFLFNIFLVIFSKQLLLKIGNYEKNSKLIEICISTLILSTIFIPLLTVNLTFDRIFRNFSILYYILAGVVMNELIQARKQNRKPILLFYSFLIIFSLVWTLGTIYRYNGFEETEYEMILNNNIFIN